MNTIDTAKTIRKSLKSELSLTTKDVSVRCSHFSMGSSITVELKTLKASQAQVSVITDRYQEDTSLKGGNMFIHVNYAHDLFDELAKSQPLPAKGETLEIFPGHFCRQQGYYFDFFTLKADGSEDFAGGQHDDESGALIAARRVWEHKMANPAPVAPEPAVVASEPSNDNSEAREPLTLQGVRTRLAEIKAITDDRDMADWMLKELTQEVMIATATGACTSSLLAAEVLNFTGVKF